MTPPPISRRLVAATVPEDGLHVDVIADRQELAAIAALNDAISVERFAARFEVRPFGHGGVAVEGRLTAATTRTCVVTLEPVVETVDEAIDLRFEPGVVWDEDAGEDQSDPLVDGVVDLGAIASEFFTLALDPYPRRPGAALQPPDDAAAPEGSPFSVLARLKAGDREPD